MASRIKIGKIVTEKGKRYKIVKPTAKGKKYKAVPVSGKGRSHHFGDKNYKVSPGTPRGDRYCKRSGGIKSSKPGASPNDFARKLWNCVGDISQKS
jgi:hypothetical protein